MIEGSEEGATEVRTYPARGGFLRPFLLLWGLGVVGVLTLIPTTYDTLEAILQTPGAPEIPVGVAVAGALLQSALVTALFVALGLLTAPRVGLRSHLVAWSWGEPGVGARFGREVSLAAGLGVLTAIAFLLFDAMTFGYLDEAWAAAAAEQGERTLAFTVMGVLYGGITEELWMRWGLVSIFAWAGAWVISRGERRPGRGMMWVAIALAALLFGLGHLPMAATIGPLTPLVVTRILVLNGIGGLVFGWLYWRRSLEAAMLAHGTVHVAISTVAWLGLA